MVRESIHWRKKTCKDSNLNKAHVRFLEKSLYKITLSNPTSIKLFNSSEPSGSKLSDSDICDMEEYLENMLFILKNLGIIDFTKLIEKDKNEIIYEETPIFYLTLTADRIDGSGKILQAKMIVTENGYRVLKNSYVEKEKRKSFAVHAYNPLREQLEKGGYFIESEYEGCYLLKQDVDFTSPSAAASIIKNRATNGKKEWKLLNGITLDEHESM